MILLAKSADKNGAKEALLAHSRHVVAKARELYHRLPGPTQEDQNLLADLELAAALHDIGKSAIGFQEMLLGRRQHWNGWRHEILSAAFASLLPVSQEVVFSVLTHHRSIPGRGTEISSRGRLRWFGDQPEDWRQMSLEWEVNHYLALQLWSQLCDDISRRDLSSANLPGLTGVQIDPAWLDNKLLRRQTKHIDFALRRRASILRGLLISADHLASGDVSLPPMVSLKKFASKFELRPFQQRCGRTGNLILRAPTGSGKTEAAITWGATNQPENGRLFYTLPYTAALNAMHDRLLREFPAEKDGIGLLHSRSAHHLYSAIEQDFPVDARRATHEALARARLAKEMYHSVRVCTPHQLLRYTMRGRGWEQMFSELPAACVVFDEIHSYDPRLTGLILGTAGLFASMGAHLMFISATLPKFLEDEIQRVAQCHTEEPLPKFKGDSAVLDRKRHQVRVQAGNLLALVPEIAERVRGGRRVLIVCNHIASARSVARSLRSILEPEDVCLFHSGFNMRDRKAIEKSLSSGQLPRALVATQVVEVSLDISYDEGFFEAAPVDALAQRMGRVNRKGERPPSDIVIFSQQIGSYPIYDTHFTDATTALLSAHQGSISETDLRRFCDHVYKGGYLGENRISFEQGLNHPYLTKFSESLVAGQHEDWTKQVIDGLDGRVDVLPACLSTDYNRLRKEGLWLDADALLVNVRAHRLWKYIDRAQDPWVIRLDYSGDGLET